MQIRIWSMITLINVSNACINNVLYLLMYILMYSECWLTSLIKCKYWQC